MRGWHEFKQGDPCSIYMLDEWREAIYFREDIGHLVWVSVRQNTDMVLIRVGINEIRQIEETRENKQNDEKRMVNDQSIIEHGIRKAD